MTHRNDWRALALLLPLLGFAAASARAAAPVAEERWAILVSGISGDPALQSRWLKDLHGLGTILESGMQFPKDRIIVLFDDPAKDPQFVRLKSTRENLEKVFRDVSARAKPEDLVFLFLAGHGNFDGKTYKLNLVGPDPTAEQIAAGLYSIPARRFVVVNTTTCSGGSIGALARKGSVVVTATKSGYEKNQTHMGTFFIEALTANAGDRDKNGRVSMLEAFSFALQKVEQYYANEGNLQTEHAVLDDNGDAQAHAKPGPDNGDGFLARTTYLDAGPSRGSLAALSPEQQETAQTVQKLEKEIEALKYAKADMPEQEYQRRLETLLLKLAEANAKLRRQ